MDGSTREQRIETVRRFNRFYTRQIGLLEEGLLRSPFTLTEARVIYEIGRRAGTTATELTGELGLDAGYLSRLLRRLERPGLIRREPAAADRRRSLLSLTQRGGEAYAALNAASAREIEGLLGRLTEPERAELMEAMGRIEGLLGGGSATTDYGLRSHRVGDMGWVVERHGVLYHDEYGWDERFEGLVAQVVAGFIDGYDPARERCWIAESRGMRLGSVFLMRHRERSGVAQLRLLLVEPSARGLGIGQRLVRECTDFATAAGYHTITLWTNSVLAAARRIYESEGYRLVDEEPHDRFGVPLVGQNWELSLTGPG